MSLCCFQNSPSHSFLPLSSLCLPTTAQEVSPFLSELTPTSPCALLQLVCEDVNVDRFYPVLYPKVPDLAYLPRVGGSGWCSRWLGMSPRSSRLHLTALHCPQCVIVSVLPRELPRMVCALDFLSMLLTFQESMATEHLQPHKCLLIAPARQPLLLALLASVTTLK